MTESHRGFFFFDPSDPIYEEHFPGQPIVPGSLIIHAFLDAVRSAGLSGTDPILENFRFRRFITPGRYRYTLSMRDGAVRCTLYEDETHVVTGTVRS
jgi:3-hydroxyacyl-[acyl-carrier-protein] dehydratase